MPSRSIVSNRNKPRKAREDLRALPAERREELRFQDLGLEAPAGPSPAKGRLIRPRFPWRLIQALSARDHAFVDRAPAVHAAFVRVTAEGAAIAHIVELDPRIGIVDHELTAEYDLVSKQFLRVASDRRRGRASHAQGQQCNGD